MAGLVALFLVSMFSCSHGVRKVDMRPEELLKYLDDGKKIEYCSVKKKRPLSKKKEGDYWNRVGVCHFLRGNYNKSIFYLDRSIKKSDKKSSARALNNLGVIHLHFHRYRRAHSFLSRAHRADSGDLLVVLNLAHLYMKFKRYDSAEKLLKKGAGNPGFKKALDRLNKMRRSGR